MNIANSRSLLGLKLMNYDTHTHPKNYSRLEKLWMWHSWKINYVIMSSTPQQKIATKGLEHRSKRSWKQPPEIIAEKSIWENDHASGWLWCFWGRTGPCIPLTLQISLRKPMLSDSQKQMEISEFLFFKHFPHSTWVLHLIETPMRWIAVINQYFLERLIKFSYAICFNNIRGE